MVFELIHYSVHAKPLETRFIHKCCAKMEAQSWPFASVLPLYFFLSPLLVLCLGFLQHECVGLYVAFCCGMPVVCGPHSCHRHMQCSALFCFVNASRYSCRCTFITVCAAGFVVACVFNRVVDVHMLATLP